MYHVQRICVSGCMCAYAHIPISRICKVFVYELTTRQQCLGQKNPTNITLPKTKKRWHPKREVIFQPSIFRGELLFQGG